MRAIAAAAPIGPNEDRVEFSSSNFVKTSEAITIGRAPERTLGKILIDSIVGREAAEMAVSDQGRATAL